MIFFIPASEADYRNLSMCRPVRYYTDYIDIFFLKQIPVVLVNMVFWETWKSLFDFFRIKICYRNNFHADFFVCLEMTLAHSTKTNYCCFFFVTHNIIH